MFARHFRFLNGRVRIYLLFYSKIEVLPYKGHLYWQWKSEIRRVRALKKKKNIEVTRKVQTVGCNRSAGIGFQILRNVRKRTS